MREQLVLLGGRIRELRRERKLTLQALADRTGLTAGLLSKIENFRTVPSLPVLMSIAAALEADMSELFAGMNFRSKPEWLLVRPGDQRPIEREEDGQGMDYALLLESSLEAVSFQVMLVTVHPRVRREPVSGGGDELLYILNGRMEYRIGGDTIPLEAGDALFFNGALPHGPTGCDDGPVTLLACYFLRGNES